MSYTTVDVVPGSPAWHTARLGRLTGSRAAAMLARAPYGEALTRRAYRRELVYERYTGAPTPPGFVSVAMRRGLALEPAAIAAYTAETGTPVARPGFLASTRHLAGCSPDGVLEGGRGILEAKCPHSATHARYLVEGRLPPEHRAQVRHNLWITGAAYCDFLSYDDRCAPRWRVCVVRVLAAELALPAYEDAALTFLADVARELRGVETLLGARGLVVHGRR